MNVQQKIGKFTPLITSRIEVTTSKLNQEFKEAYKIGSIRLGKEILFFRAGFRIYFIFYSEIYRYYRRIKVVPTRMCCSRVDLEIEYLVLCDKRKELAEIQLPDKRAALAIMERLKVLAPNAKVGVNKERKKRIKKEFVENHVN